MSDFTDLLDTFREERKIRKKDLAGLAGLSASYISLLTRGSRKRPSRDAVIALANALDLNKEERALLLKAADFATPDLPISKQVDSRQHWNDAPDILEFFGRDEETREVSSWISKENCQLVAIFGLGGVGKTTFALNLAHQLVNQNEYDHVFWYSLLNAPEFDTFLWRCTQALSEGDATQEISNDSNPSIEMLIQRLKEARCLLILDNFESVLKSHDSAGQYRPDFEAYGLLLKSIVEAKHRSCLLLTSREKPKEIESAEVKKSSVRSLLLPGLNIEQAQKLLSEENLNGTEVGWKVLIECYSGNPLSLKIISKVIKELFGGTIASFLKQSVSVIGDIRDPLDFQFNRLMELERKIMFWLAIERIKVTLDDLREDLSYSVSEWDLWEAIGSLHRRFLITIEDELLTLQPVIMDYVTEKFVSTVWSELNTESIGLFGSHALIKVSTKDSIRDRQIGIFLQPLASRLLETLRKAGSERKLNNILAKLHADISLQTLYAAGNILNLLIELEINLRDYDFSDLVVRQAYLRGKSLSRVNFENANLRTTVFTESFGSVLTVAFSPDQRFFAAGTANGEIRLWEVMNRAPHVNCEGHTDWVRSIAFSPDGKTIASGSDDKTVRLWDVETGKSFHELTEHNDWVWSVAFSPDGRFIASGGYDMKIRVWDVQSGKCLKVLEDHSDQKAYSNLIHTVAFSPDGKVVASGGADQTIRLWNIESGYCYQILKGQGKIVSIAFSRDGSTLVSGSSDEPVRLWDVSTGECLRILGNDNNRAISVAFSPVSEIIAGASEDQAIFLWNAHTGERLNTLWGHSDISALAFSPDGRTLLSGGEDDQTVQLWEVESGESIATLQGYSAWIWSVAFSPDGNSIAMGSQDSVLRLWNVQDGSCIKMMGHSEMIFGVTFSYDGRIIASASGDRTIRLWNAHTGQLRKTLRGHTHWIYTVAFSPDGKTLASGSWDETMRIWDLNTGESRIVQNDCGPVYTIAFSPDGKTLACASEDKIIRLWDVSTGCGLGILPSHTGRIWSIAFSPDGKTLASGSEDQTIRLWDVVNLSVGKIFKGHSGYVRSIAFSPDGKTLASGSHDKTVRLWDVATGNCSQVMEGHSSWVWSVSFDPTGEYIASGSHEGKLIIWDIRSGDPRQIFRNDRPYDQMKIKGALGITKAQKTDLLRLGATEN